MLLIFTENNIEKTENKTEHLTVVIVVAVITMTRHKCDDKCPNSARRGPKIKCCKCSTVCFLQCFDFEAGEKIDGQDTVKWTVNDVVITTFVSTLGFACCTNILPPNDQKKALKMPASNRSASRSRSKSDSEQSLANELGSIKEMLSSIKSATDTNTAEIAAIKLLSTQTDANVKIVTERNASTSALSTPRSPAMNYVNDFKRRAHANASAGTPGKRKRFKMNERAKLKFPDPKVGTKSNASGLTIVPRVNDVRDDKPIFKKALYVSGLGPATTNDEIANYIVEFTSVKDATKFKVHKMVKKDADISQLKFVSFKVELNVEELEVLDNVDVWPEGLRVREWQYVMGNFFPQVPVKISTSNDAKTTVDLNVEQNVNSQPMDVTASKQ